MEQDSPRFSASLEMQTRTRKERGFAAAEDDLPDFSGHTAPTSTSPSLGLRDRVYGLLSLLGDRSPVARPVGAGDTLWLLDNTAYRDGRTGRWEAEYVAAAFSQRSTCAVVDAVSAVAAKLDLAADDPDLPTVEERLRPFVQDIRPGSQASVLYRGDRPMTLGPGGRNGISTNTKKLPGLGDGDGGELIAPTFANVPEGADGVLEMKTFYAEPEGWGVISGKSRSGIRCRCSPALHPLNRVLYLPYLPSTDAVSRHTPDIDDTIKITQTSDPIGILKTTFVSTPQPVPGMPELYRAVAGRLGPGAPWFYLSASPYNLYPFLRGFRDRHYPHGTIVLRDSSWMSVSGLLSTLTLGTEDYKVGRMDRLHAWLPRRRMICVGDSTQSDPEAYGEIYRKYAGWVKVILIHKVTDIAALGIEAKNEPERFEKAFKDVPRDVWHVFTDPAECLQIVEDAVANG
ncbi:hypothetical protein GGR56DRAFT_6817 [Xylariaceae sp. FL0804]|nr:hypothetical protein GGR56DRAFT_6817 [Xylariaceae sp. FL0804]